MSLTPDELRALADAAFSWENEPDENMKIELTRIGIKAIEEAERLERSNTPCPCGCEGILEDRGRREIDAHLIDFAPASPYYRGPSE